MLQRYDHTLPRFPLADDFAFSDPKIGAGWFDIRLTCLGTSHAFTASYLGETFAGSLSVLLDLHWYYVGKAILMAHGLIGYRNAWIMSEFPLRDFRDLHEVVTGEEWKAASVEDDIRFLSLFTKAAPAGTP